MFSAERSKLERLVLSHGGVFSSDLSRRCTHLVAEVAHGKKYHGALNWRVLVVNKDWPTECVKARGRLDETLFPVKGDTNGTTSNLYESEDVSKVTASTVNSSDLEHSNSPSQPKQQVQPSAQLPHTEDEDTASEMFLGGCTILLDGFTAEKERLLATLVLSSGGTRLTTFDGSITHIVSDHLTQPILWRLQTSDHRPIVVNSKWLYDSCNHKYQLPISSYLFWLAMYTILISDRYEIAITLLKAKASEEPPILPVRLQSIVDRSSDSKESLPESVAIGNNESEETLPLSPYAASVFQKTNIYGMGFDDADNNRLRTLISSNGGIYFVDMPPRTLLHFIVAAHGTKIRQGNNFPNVPVVSFDWVVRSVEERKLLDPTSFVLFAPLPKPLPYSWFTGFIISISGFAAEERSNIRDLIQKLGATYLDAFNKKVTHLICKSPTGDKYNRALKWNLDNIVSAAWLYECARTVH